METKLDHMLVLLTNEYEFYQDFSALMHAYAHRNDVENLITPWMHHLTHYLPDSASGDLRPEQLLELVLRHYKDEFVWAAHLYDTGPYHMSTPCEEHGFKEGQIFVVTSDIYSSINKGDLVVLDDDDGTESPFFTVYASTIAPINERVCVYLNNIEPYEEDITHMTPCEARGYKVGDLFQCTRDLVFRIGTIVSLHWDDGSDCPEFKYVSGPVGNYHDLAFEDLAHVQLIHHDQQENSTMNIHHPTMETRTFIDGIDATTFSDEQIFQHIASIETKIEELSAVKRKPKKLEAEIERLTKIAADLADYVDAR